MAAVAETPATPTSNGLKKLGFVPEAGAKSYEIATNVYTTAKSYVPASLQPRLEKVEESVTNVGRKAGNTGDVRGAFISSCFGLSSC